ncbi:MAG: matrixin family metalloprotease [Clostridia bacterium]|nr:matrixin family metalloprotease [Deltaproteobacteria bacterium]
MGVRFWLASLASLLIAGRAEAFLCARVSTSSDLGPSLAWFSRDIAFTLHAAGTRDIEGDAEFDVLRASFEAWASVSVPGGTTACGLAALTDLSFRETGMSNIDRVGYDFLHPEASENLLIFRDSGWDVAESNVIALTTTTYDPVHGEILDADIEFNSTVFDFTVGIPVSMDLANTAVHEVGHFLGLAHTQSENDDATMFARAVPGETKKASLACDDALAIVFKYPAGEANGYCSPPTQTCGNCAPPRDENGTPAVTVIDKSDDGRLQYGCASMRPVAYGILLAIALRRFLRTARLRRLFS